MKQNLLKTMLVVAGIVAGSMGGVGTNCAV